ncbi:MAG TPA: hypothetical protein VG477_03285 [Thermoanaerobaculia bacterium]|nr:hypothetical protein [Thermoanaerobaculia bacterium]
MKKRKNGKISLSKETLRSLDGNLLGDVNGATAAETNCFSGCHPSNCASCWETCQRTCPCG